VFQWNIVRRAIIESLEQSTRRRVMIAKLVAAGAVVAAIASPALAADFVVRSPSAQAYVVPEDRVYGPGEIVAGTVAGAVGTAAAIATAPLVPRPYVYPTDSYAYYDGPLVTNSDRPVVTYNNDYVAPTYVRPAYRGTYWNDPAGPVCEPGTLVRLVDGRSYLCQ
jgi:hypothetical protein